MNSVWVSDKIKVKPRWCGEAEKFLMLRERVKTRDEQTVQKGGGLFQVCGWRGVWLQ